jgi:membrane protein DedA with SNARE-associated domain
MDTFLSYLHLFPGGLIYLFLGFSAFVENVFPPIPGDTITAFGAFLVGIGRLEFFWVYLSTTLGSLLGFMSLFWVGRYLGRRFFLMKDYRFLKAKDILKAEEWFKKNGYFLVAFNRFLPGIRSAISVAGGISKLGVIRVAVLALISSAVWNLIWISAGYFLGSNWEVFKARLSDFMMKYNIAILILLGLFIFFVVIRKKYRRSK